ncbi:MAG TPA: LysE family translocator [Lichenihabitans sp.]|jgi:threonine/homoserine/homoserine lactone efflux protein|nr:LysE family translocator [Lichenihabitans sp.]
MMSLVSYLAFVAASAVLIATPGPNVALIVGTSIRHGRAAGLATVIGTSAAMVVQLAATVFGLSVAILSAAHLFGLLRWAGVAYLLGLGLRALLGWPESPDVIAAAPDLGRAVGRGFAVSLTNPKTLLFYGAFLPQFVDRSGWVTGQLLLLSATFLVLAATLDTGWALLAHQARGLLLVRPGWHERISGACLITAAAGLALTHEKS